MLVVEGPRAQLVPITPGVDQPESEFRNLSASPVRGVAVESCTERFR
jgi:hypothetical protein